MQFREFERPEWKNWRPGISSWQRCFDEHRLDPARKCNPHILTSPELRLHRERMGRELNLARDELDNLFLAVRGSGYSVSLADRTGLIVLERSDYNSETYFPPDRPGSRWSEQEGGTNGIGTALLERRPVAVYHDDHFFSDLISVACIGLPVFDVEDRVLGAVNLSIRNERLSEQTHRLIFDVARVAVQRLEEKFFYDRHREAAVIRLHTDAGPAALIAIGPDAHVLGCNKIARAALAIQGGASLWDHFRRQEQLTAKSERPFTLERLDGGTLKARLTPPQLPQRQIHIPPQRDKAVVKPAHPSLDDCAGADARMQANIRLLRRLRGASLPILLLGETGTGKDTLARAIHDEAGRTGPFIAFNCAAIPESLIDSELFGYGAGAFTGARKEGSQGRFAAANGGTMFLDEIGDMPLPLQTRLLRVLETGEVMPLGGGKLQHVDIRIIAATNQALEARVAEGKFRQDLYHRLAGLVLTLPPLRERDDLALLTTRLLACVADQRLILSPAAQASIAAYAWPGNVRELRHVLTRAVMLTDSNVIEPDDLLLPAAPLQSACADPMARAERDVLEAAMRESGGDIEATARRLGFSRATLYRKLRLHGLKPGKR